jgi:predicted phage tail protein
LTRPYKDTKCKTKNYAPSAYTASWEKRLDGGFKLAVSSTAEAVRALSAIVPGFKASILNAKDNRLTFAAFNGRRNLGEDQLQQPVGDAEIRIAPILIGTKSEGLYQTILGAALIAVVVWNPAFLELSANAVSTMIGLGASMALGGVIQKLSPRTRSLASTRAIAERPTTSKAP